MRFTWAGWKNVMLRDMENGILRRRKCPIMAGGRRILRMAMDDTVTRGWKIGLMVGRGLSRMMRREENQNIPMRVDSRTDISMDMEC